MSSSHPLEIDFKRLLKSTEKLIGEFGEQGQLRLFHDAKIGKYLEVLTQRLTQLERWASQEGEARLTGQSRDRFIVPSSTELKTYRRKLKFLEELFAHDPARRIRSRASNLSIGEPLSDLVTRAKVPDNCSNSLSKN